MVISICACSANVSQTDSSKHSIYFEIENNDTWKSCYTCRSKGNETLVFPSDPKKDGYVFYGWYLEKTFINEIHEYSYLNKSITEDIHLYGKFVSSSEVKSSYDVSFNTNGGTTIPSREVSFRSLIKDVSTSRANYEFVGWYLDADFSKEWNLQYDRVRENITLYAKWQEKGFVVTYYLDGGKCSDSLQEVFRSDKPLVMPADSTFTKKGFEFGGLYLDSSFAEPYDENTTYTSDISIYVKWIPITYNITYHIPEGITAPDDMPSTFNFVDGLSIGTPIKGTGYRFVGWYLDADLLYELAELNPPANDLDLYPCFAEIEYQITYEMANATLVSNKKTYKYFDETINLPNATRVGYTFSGWYLDSKYNNAYNPNVNNHCDITVYAKWTIISYSITYYLDGGVVDGTNPSIYTIEDKLNLTSPNKDGYIFYDWYLDSSFTLKFDKDKVHYGDLKLYARFILSSDLDPDNYVQVENKSTIPFLTTETKNICIPISLDQVVVDATITDNLYVAYNDGTSNIIVINNSVLEGYTKGEKVKVEFELESGETLTYYISLVTILPYTTSIAGYYNIDSDVEYVSLTVTPSLTNTSCVYGVAIDNQLINCTVYSTTEIRIPKAAMNSLSAGVHEVAVFTDKGTSYCQLKVRNSSRYVPQNVRFIIDETYPKVYLAWDSDINYSKLIITHKNYDTSLCSWCIAGEYSSENNSFDGNRFDITDKLLMDGNIFVVSGVYCGVNYSSEEIRYNWDSSLSETAKAILDKDQGFTLYGKKNNHYITSYNELVDMLTYLMLYEDELDKVSKTYKLDGVTRTDDFVQFDYAIDFDVINDENIDLTNSTYFGEFSEAERTLSNSAFVVMLMKYTSAMMSESCAYTIMNSTKDIVGIDAPVYTLSIRFLVNKTPDFDRTKADVGNYVQANYQRIHAGVGLPSSYRFPIEKNNIGNAEVNSSIELFLALEHGYNPTIRSSNTQLANMYSKMKTILREILDESMNEYEIALAIYEYLECNVIYDYSLLDLESAYQGTDSYYDLYSYSSFYMEGVFNNGVAVCNGIAAAYSAMLNMMGIQAHKLSGLTKDNQAHAWVELCIGGEWYLSDPTWANRRSSYVDWTNSSSGSRESISYEYFLMTSAKSDVDRPYTKPSGYGRHVADDVSINIFKLMKFKYTVLGTTRTYTSYIDSVETLQYLVNSLIDEFGSKMTSGECIAVQVQFSSSSMHSVSTTNCSGYSVRSGVINNSELIYNYFLIKN